MKKQEFITSLRDAFYAVEREKSGSSIFDSSGAVKSVNAYRIKVLDLIGSSLMSRVFNFVVRNEGETDEEVMLVDNQVMPESYSTFHSELVAYLKTNPTGAESYTIHKIDYADKHAVLKVSKTDGTDIKEIFFYVKKDAGNKFQCTSYIPYTDI